MLARKKVVIGKCWKSVMNNIGQPERHTRNRIIALFRQKLLTGKTRLGKPCEPAGQGAPSVESRQVL